MSFRLALPPLFLLGFCVACSSSSSGTTTNASGGVSGEGTGGTEPYGAGGTEPYGSGGQGTSGGASAQSGGTGGDLGDAILPSKPRVAAGREHLCGIDSTGHIECWGSIGGKGSPPGDGGWDRIWSARDFNCAVKETGEARCWGEEDLSFDDTYAVLVPGTDSDTYFACGLPAEGSMPTCSMVEGMGPIPSGAPAGALSRLSCNSNYCCGLMTADQQLTCWGDTGEWGTTPLTGSYHFVDASYRNIGCALSTTGRLECWGSLGCLQGLPTAGVFKGVDVEGCGGCSIDVDGHIFCWGDTLSWLEPPAGTFASVVAGEDIVCGVRTDGTVSCVGGPSYPPPEDWTALVDE